MTIEGYVDSAAAARLLEVSARRVAQLAASGDITKAARGQYDRLSIERYLVSRRGTDERAWSRGTAWAAVAILSGRRAQIDWLSERSRYRLEATLRTITAADLVSKARNRAHVHVFSGHASVAARIRDEVIVRDWTIVGLAGATGEDVDGYIDAAQLESAVERYALVAATSGNITLRATEFDMTMVRSLSASSDVLVALDAAGSIDTRARGAGERVLDRAVARLFEDYRQSK